MPTSYVSQQCEGRLGPLTLYVPPLASASIRRARVEIMHNTSGGNRGRSGYGFANIGDETGNECFHDALLITF